MALHTTYSETPWVNVGGVTYHLDYGMPSAHEEGPVYVWKVLSLDGPTDITALPHVSRACDEKYELEQEIIAAEHAAGWYATP